MWNISFHASLEWPRATHQHQRRYINQFDIWTTFARDHISSSWAHRQIHKLCREWYHAIYSMRSMSSFNIAALIHLRLHLHMFKPSCEISINKRELFLGYIFMHFYLLVDKFSWELGDFYLLSSGSGKKLTLVCNLKWSYPLVVSCEIVLKMMKWENIMKRLAPKE